MKTEWEAGDRARAFTVEEEVDGLIWLVFARVEAGHAGLVEEGVGSGHGGEGFDVACWANVAKTTNEGDGQAQGAELRVDGDAADGADVSIDEGDAGPGGEVSEVEEAVADREVEDWPGEDGDGDGSGD